MIRHRYRRIVWFFARIIINLILWDVIFPRIGLRRWSRNNRHTRYVRYAGAFRALAISMGGVLIKVGQFMSSRVDVLPEEVTNELAGLQDEVPEENFDEIRPVIEQELNGPLSQVFAQFDEKPMAAASLGQVHQARLFNISRSENETQPDVLDVVIKVQRPNIENIIATDLAALQTVGQWLQRYPPIKKRADVPKLLGEFTKILYEEIDYLAEGRNAEIFAEHFNQDGDVLVPKVIWSHTTKKVLTLENVLGIKITDYDEITKEGVNRKTVAIKLLDTYLKQIFEDGFFHADPHPGNLFVRPISYINERTIGENDRGEGQPFQLTFVDFGMVGRISPDTVSGLREMLVAVSTRDTRRLIKAYQMLGFLLPGADLELLEKAEKTVFDRFWGKSMSELQNISISEMHEIAKELRDLIYSMPFQIPHDLIFLGRAVAILSGMCTGLDPDFNVWDHLVPFAKKIIAKETTSQAAFWVEQIKEILRLMFNIPINMDRVMSKLEAGEVEVKVTRLSEQIDHLGIAMRQMVGVIIFASFLLTGIQTFLAGYLIGGQLLLFGAGIALVFVFFQFPKKKS
ncbi:MAG: AarF/ABC1/UbiB kinase family protein [Anaerolineales bacterium]|nr:AarF/ABC1/UbiB kinase family protein [Anaerolineales bacterium]